MISADLIARYFSINHQVLHMQADGLTHEDSLRQPPFRGNCFNWVLGHIVSGRDRALKLLDQEPVWVKGISAPYDRESEPIGPDDDVLQLEQLLADLDTTQERLESALAALRPEALERVVKERTVGDRLAFLYWHEAYHTGQTEMLRQLAGTDDKVI